MRTQIDRTISGETSFVRWMLRGKKQWQAHDTQGMFLVPELYVHVTSSFDFENNFSDLLALPKILNCLFGLLKREHTVNKIIEPGL